jgi:hypothetical protein
VSWRPKRDAGADIAPAHWLNSPTHCVVEKYRRLVRGEDESL